MNIMNKVYVDAQAACGLKNGDWVEIISEAEDREAGWCNTWPAKDKDFVGKIGKVHHIALIPEQGIAIYFSEYDNWWLFPYFVLVKVEKPKHEFKPFEQVLIRDTDDESWRGDFVSCIDEDGSPICIGEGDCWKQIIPYKGNEHLVGTTETPKE